MIPKYSFILLLAFFYAAPRRASSAGTGRASTAVTKRAGELYEFKCNSFGRLDTWGMYIVNIYLHNHEILETHESSSFRYKMKLYSFDNGARIMCWARALPDFKEWKGEVLEVLTEADTGRKSVSDEFDPAVVESYYVDDSYAFTCRHPRGELLDGVAWIQLDANNLVTDSDRGSSKSILHKNVSLAKDCDEVTLVCLTYTYENYHHQFSREIQKVVVLKRTTGCWKGPQGPPAAQGARGPAGEDGLPGVSGSPGAKGERGVKGHSVTGLNGLPGPRGFSGAKGEPGLKGDSVKGQKGEPGLNGLPGPRGFSGAKGEPGVKGVSVMGPPGVCAVTCPRVTMNESPLLGDDPPKLGSEEWPAPYVCKFRPETAAGYGPAPDPYWLKEDEKFPVKCEAATNRTCLVGPRDDAKWVKEHKILMSNAPEGMWLSRQGFDLDVFNTISQNQLNFLKQQSRSARQAVRVYLLNAVFEDIQLAVLNYNDVVVEQAPTRATPMVYTVGGGGASVELSGETWSYVELELSDSAQRLPLVDVFVQLARAPAHARDVYVSVQLRELCFG